MSCCIRDLDHPSLNFFQCMTAKMISHHKGERQRERSRSRDRLHPHAQVAQVPQIQPMVTPEPESDEDFTAMNPSSPSAGSPPSAEQRGRSRREGRSRSRERVPPHSPSNASQQPQPGVPPSGAHQTQTLATQGSDEDSAIVDPHNRVSDRSMSPQKQEGSRRQGPQIQKGKKLLQKISQVIYRRPKSTSPWIQMRTMKNLKNEPLTSSNFQPTIPVLPLHPGPAASSQGPAASTISGE